MKQTSAVIAVFLNLLLLLVPGCREGEQKPGVPSVPAAGEKKVKLGEALAALEMKTVSCAEKTLVLRHKSGKTVKLTIDSTVVTVDDIPVFMPEAVTGDAGELRWELADYPVQAILKPILEESRAPVKKILIDPGHGGKAPGTVSASGVQEKELNMRLSQAVAEKFRAKGYQVVLTREDDRDIPLDERPALAEKYQADLFISIHHNAAANLKASGYEVFFLNSTSEEERPATARSASFAYSAVRALNFCSLIPSRGVKSARYKVLRLAKVPAILVEAGFMSNQDEMILLDSDTFRESFAAALAEML